MKVKYLGLKIFIYSLVLAAVLLSGAYFFSLWLQNKMIESERTELARVMTSRSYALLENTFKELLEQKNSDDEKKKFLIDRITAASEVKGQASVWFADFSYAKVFDSKKGDGDCLPSLTTSSGCLVKEIVESTKKRNQYGQTIFVREGNQLVVKGVEARLFEPWKLVVGTTVSFSVTDHDLFVRDSFLVAFFVCATIVTVILFFIFFLLIREKKKALDQSKRTIEETKIQGSLKQLKQLIETLAERPTFDKGSEIRSFDQLVNEIKLTSYNLALDSMQTPESIEKVKVLLDELVETLSSLKVPEASSRNDLELQFFENKIVHTKETVKSILSEIERELI